MCEDWRNEKFIGMSKINVSDGMYRMIKIVLVVVGLWIAYLFALNNRYVVTGGEMEDLVFDKWKGEAFPMRATWYGN